MIGHQSFIDAVKNRSPRL